MADSDPSDKQRHLEQRPTGSRAVSLHIRGIISSPRVRHAAVRVWCVLKVIIYAGVILVFLTICRLVVHNQAMLANLQVSIVDLSNKIEALSAFIRTQQQTLLSLLSKFESQDKNTQEMVQSIKEVQQMSQRQAVADGGALEKKVGKAVIGIGQFVAPRPIKFIMLAYDLLTALATWVKNFFN